MVSRESAEVCVQQPGLWLDNHHQLKHDQLWKYLHQLWHLQFARHNGILQEVRRFFIYLEIGGVPGLFHEQREQRRKDHYHYEDQPPGRQGRQTEAAAHQQTGNGKQAVNRTDKNQRRSSVNGKAQTNPSFHPTHQQVYQCSPVWKQLGIAIKPIKCRS